MNVWQNWSELYLWCWKYVVICDCSWNKLKQQNKCIHKWLERYPFFVWGNDCYWESRLRKHCIYNKVAWESVLSKHILKFLLKAILHEYLKRDNVKYKSTRSHQGLVSLFALRFLINYSIWVYRLWYICNKCDSF
jgi:hypothetical protein